MNKIVSAVAAFAVIAAASTAGTTTASAVTPVRGRVDVCAIETPKSWTKGLQRKANRAFQQRVKVYRVTEWTLADQPCDLFLWTTGDRNSVGISPADGEDMYELTVTAKTHRPRAIVRTLKDAGIVR